MTSCTCYRRTGDLDTEIAVHRKAATIGETLEVQNWLATVLANLGEAIGLAGDPAEALTIFVEAGPRAGGSNGPRPSWTPRFRSNT